ncbi:hypothetical protein EB233_22250 [Mesorhizobium erdmanii]|uniref:Uncharacterized protein n=1 Tax=Mesorhizobium erdmanii TaxID=1777866 RepID=A0A6M7UKR8_9HYPH|nr:hypothetical protein EB233_22250 [Mesorhizobium erdmanii]
MSAVDLPTGSTRLSHEHTAAIDEAVEFLIIVPPLERPRPLVPALREMFGLSPFECCEAIRESHRPAIAGRSSDQ